MEDFHNQRPFVMNLSRGTNLWDHLWMLWSDIKPFTSAWRHCGGRNTLCTKAQVKYATTLIAFSIELEIETSVLFSLLQHFMFSLIIKRFILWTFVAKWTKQSSHQRLSSRILNLKGHIYRSNTFVKMCPQKTSLINTDTGPFFNVE